MTMKLLYLIENTVGKTLKEKILLVRYQPMVMYKETKNERLLKVIYPHEVKRVHRRAIKLKGELYKNDKTKQHQDLKFLSSEY